MTKGFTVVQLWSYGTTEIQDSDKKFKVNRKRLKEYNDEAFNTLKTIIHLYDPSS